MQSQYEFTATLNNRQLSQSRYHINLEANKYWWITKPTRVGPHSLPLRERIPQIQTKTKTSIKSKILRIRYGVVICVNYYVIYCGSADQYSIIRSCLVLFTPLINDVFKILLSRCISIVAWKWYREASRDTICCLP